jgi:hypothetical protein
MSNERAAIPRSKEKDNAPDAAQARARARRHRARARVELLVRSEIMRDDVEHFTGVAEVPRGVRLRPSGPTARPTRSTRK